MVTCGTCGIEYDCSARTYRDIKAGRVEARCGLHRPNRQRRNAIRRAELRRFWLDRFSLDEIREMATAIAPLPSQRSPTFGSALTASAPPGPTELGG